MSRSYKKFPKIKIYYGKSGKFDKRLANKKIRKLPIYYDISDGKEFKKLNESYNIWDYSCLQFKEWEIKKWEKEESEIINNIYLWRHHQHKSLENALIDWKKTYLNK